MKTIRFSPDLKTLRFLLITPAVLVLWWLRMPLSDLLRMIGDPKAIGAYLQGFGAMGLLVLFLLLLAQVFIAMIPGHALVMASGYIYGAPVTIAVVASSTILGSQIAFSLARRSGRPLIYKLASPAVIQRWDKFAGNRGPLFYFFTFVLPIFPSDLMCYIAGLGKVSPRGFFAANVAGRILCTVAITLIGAFGFRPPLGFWLLVAGSLLLFLIAWLVYDKSFSRIPTKRAAACAAGSAISQTYRSVLGIRYDAHGLDTLPPGPKILAANHPGASDALLLPPLFGSDLVVLAEAGQFRNLLLGWILKHQGHIPVRADRPQQAYHDACEALRMGRTVLIFPEGTLSSECQPGKARSGAVRLSLASGAPIIPVGIFVRAQDMLNLRWHARGRGHGGRYQFRGRYAVRVGRAWLPGAEEAEGQRPAQVHEWTRVLMGKINALAGQAAFESGMVAPAIIQPEIQTTP